MTSDEAPELKLYIEGRVPNLKTTALEVFSNCYCSQSASTRTQPNLVQQKCLGYHPAQVLGANIAQNIDLNIELWRPHGI